MTFTVEFQVPVKFHPSLNFESFPLVLCEIPASHYMGGTICMMYIFYCYNNNNIYLNYLHIYNIKLHTHKVK